jgi:uncharacterized membrane protein
MSDEGPEYQHDTQPEQRRDIPPPTRPLRNNAATPYSDAGRVEPPTTIGLPANVVAGLSYLSMAVTGPILPLIFFFVEKKSRFVRFHAAQGLLLTIVAVAFAVLGSIGAVMLGIITAAIAGTTGDGARAGSVFVIVFTLVWLVLGIGWIVYWLWGMVAGFSGSRTRLPGIGPWADRMADGGSAQPTPPVASGS